MKTSHPSRTFSLFLALLLLFSAGFSLLCFHQFRASPFFTVPMIDEESYVSWAEEILAGRGSERGVFYQDPLYPYFLALVFRLGGRDFGTVRLLQAAMAVAAVALIALTARRLWGDAAGFIAGLFLSFYAALYYYSLLLLKAEMVLFLSVLALALGLAAAERPAVRLRWAALGAVLGLLCLLRGNILLLLPLVLAWAYAGLPGLWRHRLERAAILAAGTAVMILPVTARNYALSGELVLVTSQGGANFYIGNQEGATGRYRAPPFVRPHPRFEAEDFRREAERRAGRPLSASEVSRFWFHEGLRWLAAHPGEALRLWLHKARLVLHHYEVPDNHSFSLIRAEFVPALRVAVLGAGLLWGPALAGMLVLVRRERRAVLPALFTLVYALSLVPFFVVSRYRTALAPGLCLFAAGFVVWAVRKMKEGEMKRLALPAVVIAGVEMAALVPIAEQRANRWEEYYLLAEAWLEAGRPAEALRWYERTLELNPADHFARAGWKEAVSRLGRAEVELLVSAGEKPGRTVEELLFLARRLREVEALPRAARMYERVLLLQPDQVEAHLFLAYAYRHLPGSRNLGRAASHYRAVLAQRPADAELLTQLASCLEEGGDAAGARLLYQEVLKLAPDNQAARQALERMDERAASGE